MDTANSNIRHLLRNRLAELVERNPKYSLRAFAKKIGVSPSVLSRLINGKRAPSLPLMLRLSQELDFDMADITDLNGSVREANSSQQKAHSKRQEVLSLDKYKVIADWYHFPLLELIRTRGFKSDEHWISKRLGLPLSVVQAALDRLEKLELIERKNDEIKLVKDTVLRTSDDISSSAIRKHHTQMLEKAKEALLDNPDQREFRALNLNFEPQDLNEAQKMIREFYKKFNKRFGRSSASEVYELNLQFFKLTK